VTTDDTPFKTHDQTFADDAAEIEPASPPGMAEGDGAELRLSLLLPDTLPIEQSVSEAERIVLRGALADLLHALRLTDRAASLAQLDSLLLRLADEPGGDPARIGETGIPADAAHIDDFDSYFRVVRIASPQPALALVRGLAQTALAVMALFARAPHLPEARVQQQIDGFVTYTHVLARTFGLGELS
jgi:hypothetical protein